MEIKDTKRNRGIQRRTIKTWWNEWRCQRGELGKQENFNENITPIDMIPIIKRKTDEKNPSKGLGISEEYEKQTKFFRRKKYFKTTQKVLSRNRKRDSKFKVTPHDWHSTNLTYIYIYIYIIEREREREREKLREKQTKLSKFFIQKNLIYSK